MATMNPDPHPKGHHILPMHCVTAIFENASVIPKVLADLRAAQVQESDIQVFVGEEGAMRLDAEPNDESPVRRFLQFVTKALADDAGYLERAGGKIRKGGAVVLVPVDDDDDAAAQRATNVLKVHGGQQVQQWKEWVTEQL